MLRYGGVAATAALLCLAAAWLADRSLYLSEGELEWCPPSELALEERLADARKAARLFLSPPDLPADATEKQRRTAEMVHREMKTDGETKLRKARAALDGCSYF